MSLFNRFIEWLAQSLKPAKPQLTYRGKPVSRHHALQLKRQRANDKLRRNYRR